MECPIFTHCQMSFMMVWEMFEQIFGRDELQYGVPQKF